MGWSTLGCVLIALISMAGSGCAHQGTGAGRPDSLSDLLDFALAQWRAYPEMRIEDAYKWLYQSRLGGEHAVADDTGPRKWLDEEWAGLGPPLPGEAPAESLRSDGSLLRINLRPYKAAGGDPEGVLDAFVRSARGFHGDKAAFRGAWEELGGRLDRAPVGLLSHADWKALDDQTRVRDYPALHHSKEYEAAYHPAYRVILARTWRADPHR